MDDIPSKSDALLSLYNFLKGFLNLIKQKGTDFYQFYIYVMLYQENPYYGLNEDKVN